MEDKTPATLTPLQEATTILRARGVTLTLAPGEYVVNWPGGDRSTEYRTSDLDEAMAHGLAMGAAPDIPPPLGPMGTANGRRRGRIYAHNRRVAARRQKRIATGDTRDVPFGGQDGAI